MSDSATAPLAASGLGDTELRAAPLGLAGSHGLTADDAERAFHELGINYFFVTSRMPGAIEGVRRLVRAGHRDRIVIAAGAGIPTGRRVRKEWERMARQLDVETIDVFHLFWVQRRWYVTGKTWPAMEQLKREGKARALAISCHDRPMALELTRELDLDLLMCRYNAAHRGAEQEIFAELPARRPAVVTYTATRWGKLLKQSGGLSPMTAGECYRFALSHPRVDLVLCSPSSWDELVADAAAVREGPLSAERLEEVRAFGDRVRASFSGRVGFLGA